MFWVHTWNTNQFSHIAQNAIVFCDMLLAGLRLLTRGIIIFTSRTSRLSLVKLWEYLRSSQISAALSQTAECVK